jgi:YrbI family 3-deoxy-D-manno-octulosonate 8-phosphate phosphatase
MPKHFLHQNLRYLKQIGKIDLSDSTLDSYANRSTEIGIEDLLNISDKTSISVESLLFKNLEATHSSKHNIKLLVLDVDGVMTDGSMYLTENGDEIKRFNAKDGMAIKKCIENGIQVAIISNGSRKNAIEHRGQMLGIEKVYVGKDKKLDVLKSWLPELNVSLKEVAYIGDDINDIPVMQNIALSACPANAVKDVLKTATITLQKNGGEGCVREFVENYLVENMVSS